jgi:pseudomonalisin
MPTFVGARSSLAGLLILAAGCAIGMGQRPVNRILGPIREAEIVTLEGNVHPLAREEFDRGVVSPGVELGRIVLELEPTAAQQAELDALVAAQDDPHSPLYQQWLTPAEYGARFGASAEDVSRITVWLNGHGFTVEEVPASNRLIVFSGTAGQVAETFHTGIHRYVVNGVEHIANAQDPQIPAALHGLVGGVVSLHDFRRRSEIETRTAPGAQPLYTSGSTHYLFPADWATIYDLNPLYAAGTTGMGSSIAIAGRSNINVGDVTAFRATAGLAANNPAVILAGADPGLVTGDQDEATLDVEWSGAIAPAASVMLVVGTSTETTDGVDLSAQYIVNHALAPVVSTSYGSCEQEMGTAELAFYNSLWEQAASQGMSTFVASGDAGAAGCYEGSSTSGSGTAVNGLCSSAYATCVGGTEFNEGSNPAQYWTATNSANYGTALSYIPEEVWNESGLDGGYGLWASGGGMSVVYAQPAWQKDVSATSVGMRTVPDVAVAAAEHDGYVIYENGSYSVVSGTSASSPSFAGMMALVVQKQGATGLGNANPELYSLSNAAQNPFHATPSGNNSVPGVTGFTASGAEYNLATGLGSVDGALLVSEWGAGSATGMNFALTASAPAERWLWARRRRSR